MLTLIANAGETYAQADAPLRRSMNQAWFDHLYVTEEDGRLTVSEAAHNQLSEAVRTALVARSVGTDNKQRRQRDSDGVDTARGSNVALLVEPRGLEPLTPCLQSRCATNCAKAPGDQD